MQERGDRLATLVVVVVVVVDIVVFLLCMQQVGMSCFCIRSKYVVLDDDVHAVDAFPAGRTGEL